jgi:hypothetical protein
VVGRASPPRLAGLPRAAVDDEERGKNWWSNIFINVETFCKMIRKTRGKINILQNVEENMLRKSIFPKNVGPFCKILKKTR